MSKCNIKNIGKFRNGTPKLWCSIHYSFAKSISSELSDLECEFANKPKISEDDKFTINPNDWDGGIGVWGSLNPVYNTSMHDVHKEGIHLHARQSNHSQKTIDFTFREINILTDEKDLFNQNKYITIDTETALAYTASMVFNKEMSYLVCPHCSRPHIDAGYYSVTYHKKHLCTFCGREFRDFKAGISNPVVEIQRVFKSSMEARSIELVDRQLIINQQDFPGGIQIWGSNPAILWTASRREEAGIHVHVYSQDGKPEVVMDDTYGKVVIDGYELNERQIRCLMVQNSLAYLLGKVVELNCSSCGEPHFDLGDNGVRPHKTHLCEYCDSEFTSIEPSVGNPIIGVLKKLKMNLQSLQK